MDETNSFWHFPMVRAQMAIDVGAIRGEIL
jgi:hypothetical protein